MMETAMVDGVEYKLCKRGHVRSPENVDKRGTCKLCMRIHSAKWAEANPDYKNKYREENASEIKTRRKTFRDENKERINRERRESYQLNTAIAEKFKNKSKQYRSNFPERSRAAIKRWELNNHEKVKAAHSKCSRKATSELRDTYILTCLRIFKTNVPREIIELKRQRILEIRALKELKNALKGE